MKEIKQTITKIEATYDLMGMSHEEMCIIIKSMKTAKNYIRDESRRFRNPISPDDQEEIDNIDKVLKEITNVCKGLMD